jgi:hypothetical protein
MQKIGYVSEHALEPLRVQFSEFVGTYPTMPVSDVVAEVHPLQVYSPGRPVGRVPVHANWKEAFGVPSACAYMAVMSVPDVSWVKLRATVVKF